MGRPAEGGTPAREVYTYGGNRAVDAPQEQRTAAVEADFFLPYLQPGIRLLDAGCGRGSITAGLAEVVAPGLTAGLDIDARQLQAARTLAAQHGVTTIRVHLGNLYALPFANASFDAVFAHHVLQHLREPLRALQEMRRVLKPGGVAGVRDPDEGATLLAPSTPLIDELLALTLRVRQRNGGSPFYARDLRRLMLQAGFVQAEAQVVARGGGTLEATRRIAAGLLARLAGPAGGEAIVRLGWANRERLDAMVAELRAWGERPDAFYTSTICSAVAWV
jgi:SAM-dependent methyltransferase